MNKERILQLADIVEKGHHKFNGIHAAFNMEMWFQDLSRMHYRDYFIPINREDLIKEDRETVLNCNAVACLAGFTCLLFDYDNASQSFYFKNSEEQYCVKLMACDLLDLDFYEAYLIFVSRTSENISGIVAARMLRHFVKTGEINWGMFIKENVGDAAGEADDNINI